MPSEISAILTGKRPPLDHDTKVLINMIFARFHHIYTHRFESAYRDETTLNQAKREWAMSLADTPAELIEYALERCKTEHAWPPTIAEFIKLLQPSPESIGLPATNAAYVEACRNAYQATGRQWSHLCVKMAALEVSYYSLKSEPEKLTRPLFEKAYLNLVKRIIDGETLEIEQPIALPEPNAYLSDELIAQLIAAGVAETKAPTLAYYMEKPKQSDVRSRYRERAQQELEQLGIEFNLPD
ncbi:hypothetical protein BCF53_102219 [Reinekea marinisedimentorum]|uniref:Replicative helicase inhibitor G39P N-terminal domain-containing protein n=2 Tax=Reinekea marinisedimentorum TaxID=230495 RepID=A0A4R3IC07_9GAMM|nr:hypothetical protein BCF53_102219 [Reinekea marinisedimentorum]